MTKNTEIRIFGYIKLFVISVCAILLFSFEIIKRDSRKGYLLIVTDKYIFVDSKTCNDSIFLTTLNNSKGYELGYRTIPDNLKKKAKFFSAEVNYNTKDSSFSEQIKVGVLPVKIYYKKLGNKSEHISNELFRIKDVDYHFKYDMNSHMDIHSIKEYCR